MDPEILIRPARSEELAAVEALVKSAYREFQSLFSEKVWAAWLDNIGKVIHSPTGVLLVAADRDGRLHGAVKFYPDAGQAHLGVWPPGAASMRILAVHPDSRGRGYGRLLVQECLRRAREAQVAVIYLYTTSFMAAARQLYEGLGFSRAPEFEKDPDAIVYRLDLREASQADAER